MGVTITEAAGVTQEATTRGLVKGMDERKKAPRDGYYVLDNNVFGIRAGDPLPFGAVMDGEEESAAATTTVTVSVKDLDEVKELVAAHEVALQELEAVKAERDALLAEKEASDDYEVAHITLPDNDAEKEPEERAKGKAPSNRSRGAAPENRGA